MDANHRLIKLLTDKDYQNARIEAEIQREAELEALEEDE